jgi:hypothetical protein
MAVRENTPAVLTRPGITKEVMMMGWSGGPSSPYSSCVMDTREQPFITLGEACDYRVPQRYHVR